MSDRQTDRRRPPRREGRTKRLTPALFLTRHHATTTASPHLPATSPRHEAPAPAQPRSQREFCARKPKRIGQEGLARGAQTLASTFLASTTHGVEVALEHPARPAADGQTGARARSSPHLSVSTPGGRASSERSSTTPTQRLSTSGQAGGSGWRSTDRSPFEAFK